jgi:hypothetical protein
VEAKPFEEPRVGLNLARHFYAPPRFLLRSSVDLLGCLVKWIVTYQRSHRSLASAFALASDFIRDIGGDQAHRDQAVCEAAEIAEIEL